MGIWKYGNIEMSKIRFVTAASLFDGHDVSINIIRRILQSKGVEVIHLGHNRTAQDIVKAALDEDVQAVAISSYQGGHNEYFLYIRELLDKAGATKIKIFGGGGGVITPKEIKELEANGIERVYSPADGMELGLEGIIEDMIKRSSYSTLEGVAFSKFANKKLSSYEITKVITAIEDGEKIPLTLEGGKTPVLGITGTGGAGKSSLIDEILLRIIRYYPDKKVALVSVDPTKKKTSGALLGDRIRLGSASNQNVFIRSLATRDSKTALSPEISKVVKFLRTLDFDLVMVESSGIGQASDEITAVSDKCIYVMTPEFGAQTQLEKIEMLEVADMIVINKFEKPRSEDALRDVRKQYRRNHAIFEGHPGSPSDEGLPVFGTTASKFNDTGVNSLFLEIVKTFGFKKDFEIEGNKSPKQKGAIIPAARANYLRDIAKVCFDYNLKVDQVANKLREYEALEIAAKILKSSDVEVKSKEVKAGIGEEVFKELFLFDDTVKKYSAGEFSYSVRGSEFKVITKFQSLSGLSLPKVAFPKFDSIGAKYRYVKKRGLPGFFPYSAGIFPFKRSDEDPKRMFAGEGGPARTNKRFHYLSVNDPAKRLSTAFDSATLYGEDPNTRPDIFGKIGEAGVSIATIEDMKLLFKGFKLSDKMTSVSMTINGPAPIMLAMFMNTAVEQELSGSDRESREKQIEVMRKVRGTVQADILKEDQAQNTCVFSLDFAIKMMGDVQEFFCKNCIANYYTVSVSGYHIAEAGANPITQLAFTLSNGFTYVEYYLSRGMKIDDFCQNLSFFFSNGLDPEYTVLGTVARKIWSVAMRDKYGADSKSQKFKYHIQTSGRSLHAQEIDFNDIRTTLQAYLALSDSCNSLHTNAYDEAITTPTEESVRRAMAIQMIINREFGLNKTDNPMQGAYLFEELVELVEDAVLKEFEVISDKGGVLGAMESMYQRSKIQEESLYYERLKDSGELPIIGVNSYIADNIKEQMSKEIELSRCTYEEKNDQVIRVENFKKNHGDKSKVALESLRAVALGGNNIFEELLSTVRYCSLGEITKVLYEVGGEYRRNM